MITGMQIFHIAEKSRWEAARLAGSYAQSTYGRTLEDEGYIHAAREDQWQGVLERYYAEAAEPLVLLVIDTDLLTAPWSEDEVGETTYPHIHGPLNPAAVVEERPIPRQAVPPESPFQTTAQTTPQTTPQSQSFARLFLGELVVRMVAAVVVMALVVAGYYAAQAVLGDDLAPIGLLVGLLVALAIVIPVLGRRNRRIAKKEGRSPTGDRPA